MQQNDSLADGHRHGGLDRGYAEAISHPFFEDVAKQMLRADAVHTIEHGCHSRPPAQATGPHKHWRSTVILLTLHRHPN